MNFDQRCRMFSLGLTLWICVVAVTMEHHDALSQSLGVFHAGLAGMVTASAFMPRTMLRWP